MYFDFRFLHTRFYRSIYKYLLLRPIALVIYEVDASKDKYPFVVLSWPLGYEVEQGKNCLKCANWCK